MSAPPSAVLLVTGSRALCDTPEAGAWACRALNAALSALATAAGKRALLVCGDASGPDAWAVGRALVRGVTVHQYRLDGRVWGLGRAYDDAGTPLWPWCVASPAAYASTPRQWPLRRNERMVLAAGGHALDGARVYALALVAAWSRTHGTMHTARLAMRAGLWTDVRACPAARGPQGARS